MKTLLGIIATMVGTACLLAPPTYLLVWWIDSASVCGSESGLYFPKGETWKIWLLALAWFNSIPLYVAAGALGRSADRSARRSARR